MANVEKLTPTAGFKTQTIIKAKPGCLDLPAGRNMKSKCKAFNQKLLHSVAMVLRCHGVAMGTLRVTRDEVTSR
ncbi:hypothetical protein ATANTOWER_008811 [Ataeniobius toweri]|uniref:Uncharacterized protein n=1 Tax=Ataeniobius toweri TaxID=208326 RepID=A0ABU7AA28_9TELE|nr:hypothetical protein [Ataeniobius toweri]